MVGNTVMIQRIKKHNYAFSLAFSLTGLLLVFIGGAFSSNTKNEMVAEYASQVVLNNTNGHSLCAITVQKTSDSGALPDSNSEFHNLYGVFKQNNITFASTINSDKQRSIYLSNSASDNLSMLYVGPVGTKSYNGHYKHYVSPIEVMFEDKPIYDNFRYIAYISQRHADNLLEKEFQRPRQADGSYSLSDYESLLHSGISVFVDGEESIFGIQNIYYESNYYYDGLHEVIGDFVMVSYYLPNNLRAEQANMYFMSDFTYHNRYFMNYISSVYSSRKYLVKVNRYNLVGNVDDNLFLSFYYSDLNGVDWLHSIFMIVAISFMAASLLLFYFFGENVSVNRIHQIILRFGILYLPYLFFFMLSRLTSNVIFFSESSTKWNVGIIIGYLMMFIVASLAKGLKLSNLFASKKDYYEITI